MEQKIPTVLIVEDETPLRKALARKLSSSGFEVREARDGEEGLNLALHEHPDLILLDIIMPVMDGLTMLKKMRADEWGKTARVIILTNLSDEGASQQSLENGALDFLVKAAWTMDDVLLRVRAVLEKSVQAAA